MSLPHVSGRADATFPALQSLWLAGPDMLYCTSLISIISPSQLREVAIKLCRATPNLWKRILVALGSSRNTLTRLDITEVSWPGSSDEGSVGWDCLEPLTALRRLKKVVIEPVRGLDLDDEHFSRLVSAWPMIEHLQLGSIYKRLQPSCITLAGLAPLVEKCPNICCLGLNIDVTECSTQILQTTLSRSRLMIMSVGCSPIRDPIGTAQFLHGLFPQLSVTESGFSALPTARELWHVVSKVLCFMRDHPGETPPPMASGQWL